MSVEVVLDCAGTLVRPHRVVSLTGSGRVLTHTSSTELASRKGECALVSLDIDPAEVEGEGYVCELVLRKGLLTVPCARAHIGEEHVRAAMLAESRRAALGERCATMADLLELRRTLVHAHPHLDYITSGMLVDTEQGRIAGLVCAGGVLEQCAITAVRELSRMAGVHICSGDTPAIVQRIAQKLGLSRSAAVGHCAPACKAAHVRALKRKGVVVMVGDGINDVLAVRQADVGVAMAAYTTPPDQLLSEADVVVHSHAQLVRLVRDVVQEKG